MYWTSPAAASIMGEKIIIKDLPACTCAIWVLKVCSRLCNVHAQVSAAVDDKAPLYQVSTPLHISRITEPLVSSYMIQTIADAERDTIEGLAMGAETATPLQIHIFINLCGARANSYLVLKICWMAILRSGHWYRVCTRD